MTTKRYWRVASIPVGARVRDRRGRWWIKRADSGGLWSGSMTGAWYRPTYVKPARPFTQETTYHDHLSLDNYA